MGGHADTLPYWHVNVPVAQRTDECPDFLANASPRDRKILSTPDSDYHRLSWAEVKDIINRNRIDLFQRVPSDLRRYLAFNHKLKAQYGSVMDFVLTERLKWNDLKPSGPPFSTADDIKILYNDWPYGLDKRIVHLVVWVKFELEDDPGTGFMTEHARRSIEDYVDKTFHPHVTSENLIYFKNWKGLKSIESVEHFHVMMFDPDPKFLDTITGGDIPLSEKF